MSIYTAKITWNNDSPDTFAKNKYSRAHTWSFDGGVSVPGSSSSHVVPTPWSDESAVDPEEAFVASISSCHMLTFLWIASRKGYVVDSYIDNAVGTLEKDADGRVSMTEVKLRPEITWVDDYVPDSNEIATMHHAAHEGCYIANSVRTHIVVETLQAGGA
ncbi:MAG: OsmC family protein [Pyrinomonadaceae bacterium]